MGLRDIGASLPPGFRFYPSDEELVCHYLYKKIANEQVLKGTDLVEIDLHTCEPWQLPEVAKPNANEWYFFSFRDRKYATGYRANRATTSGYWKATGKDRTIHDPRTCAIAGKRKTLVFYRNRAPNGIKTGWIMHEFRLENPHVPPKEDWVLCRVFQKSKGSENSPPNVSDRVTGQTMITSFSQTPPHQNQNQNQNPNDSTIQKPSALSPNLLQLSRDIINDASIDEVNSKCDDEYGFLFDLGFEESCLGDGVPQNLEEMICDDDDDDDGSLVFL